MLRLLGTMVLAMILFVACGDSGSTDTNGLSDDTSLGSLDESQKIEVCTELVANSPASCWSVENWWRLKDNLPDSISACIDRLDASNPTATLGLMEYCYTEIEGEECVYPSLDCSALIPMNNAAVCDQNMVDECRELLQCGVSRSCGDLCDCGSYDPV